MLYVLISVLCSVSVAVIIKLARIKGVNHIQMIVWNYPVAILMTYMLLDVQLVNWGNEALPWHIFLPLAILLPSGFVCIALSIQHSGIVKTEVAQRLSLFIPLIAAFTIFNETISNQKLIGISVGLLAILFSIGWKKGGRSKQSKTWIYPLLVFFGIGVIDILLKKISLYTAVSYMSSMWIVFVLSWIVSLLFLSYWIGIAKEKFDKRAVLWGILMGGFNFANILFYMKAHRALSENPSIVFTGMNIGVITIGVFVGVFFFKERLNWFNIIGVTLAVVSVLLIAYL